MKDIYLGTDSGATTSKTAGIFADGSPISLELAQSSTNSQSGTKAVINGWIEGIEKFLHTHKLSWQQVRGVGLAIPGPYQGYGVLDRAANLPPEFEGWNFYEDYSAALAQAAGRAIPLTAGNDGNYGGVAEAAKIREKKKENVSVIMLAPGSGLGCAYVNAQGFPLDGDTLTGMEAAHMPAPLHLLNLPKFDCGCGRSWGCVEAYTSISGLPQFLDYLLPKYPDHELAHSADTPKEKVLSLRTRAQKGDPLALEIFDFQAKALGLHVASLSVALDARYVVIGGGLIDPQATTEEFRNQYLDTIRASAAPWLYPMQTKSLKIVPAELGELSQGIGAALVALYTNTKNA
ncbi:MAG: ROK family protein [Chthoniobacterales bacterium]